MGSVFRFAIRGKAICDDRIQTGEVPEGIAKSSTRGGLVCIWSTPASGELVTGNHQQDRSWQRKFWAASGFPKM